MKNNIFRTYQKSNKYRLSKGMLYNIICFAGGLILFLDAEFNMYKLNHIDTFIKIIVLISMMLMFYEVYKSYNKIEALNGKIIGSFELFSDKIILNNQTTFLTGIISLNINLIDYCGKRSDLLINTWYPSLSNGFGNTVSIHLKTNEKIEACFETKSDWIKANSIF